MKICFLYRDLLGGGGAPGEIRSFVNSVSKKHKVSVWIKKSDKIDAQAFLDESVSIFQYKNLCDLIFKFSRFLKKNRCDYVVGVGFFFLESFIASVISKARNVRFILWPLAQLMMHGMQGKVFTVFPAVEALERKDVNDKQYLGYLLSKFAKYYKRLYQLTFGVVIDRCATFVGFFSSEEYDQYKYYFPQTTIRPVSMRWGIDDIKRNYTSKDFYSGEEKVKIVFWGRIDWYYKGIDRIIRALVYAKNNFDSIPFHVYFCGPDYHGGKIKLNAYIENNALADHVTIVDDYKKGSLDPLVSADYSILLSRWDGVPRALRESLLLDVPIIVSAETHFADFINVNKCGYVIKKPDDEKETARQLMDISSFTCLEGVSEIVDGIKEEMTWDKSANDFVSQLEASMSSEGFQRAI